MFSKEHQQHEEHNAKIREFNRQQSITHGEVIYTDAQKRKIVNNMRKYGGSFVKALGEALHKADYFNALKIYAAFPEYCQQYLTKFKN